MSADERQAVLQAFLAKGRLSSPRLLGADELAWGKARTILAAAEGHLSLGGQDIVFRVGLCPRFPLVLPELFVASPGVAGYIPHVDNDGNVCFLPKEGLLLDHHAPVGILDEALDAAAETVARGLSGENWGDFVDEIEAYWKRLAGGELLISYIEPDDRLRRVEVAFPRRGKPSLVADSFETVRSFHNEHLSSPPLQKALYVPLGKSIFEERFRPEDLLSPPWTRSFVQRHLSAENRRELRSLGGRTYPWTLIVFGLPRAGGGKGLIALEYREVSGGSPLVRGTTPLPPRGVALGRRDRVILMARAEGAVDLKNKRVAIAGCGAVGGHLAVFLARAGVGRLTLIDPDSFGAENTTRHVLGKSAMGFRKVHALMSEIRAKTPHVEVVAHATRVEDMLHDGSLDLAALDLLIYSAGDLTVGLHVNEFLHALAGGPALLFTWLEPYGIGGHALLSHTGNAEVRGCFGCLFDVPSDEPRANRADFAGPGQEFSKDVSGCAARYTPYGDLDAVRTAELSARLAIDSLRGRSVGHPLLSWKGDADAFRAAGFRTSVRYELSEKEMQEARLLYVRERCAVCGGG